jgi:Asp-tRNA(Asn)/Glu-tRNA(Gln) amidotransferase A subunit family amidase
MTDLRHAGPAGLNLLTATEAAERLSKGQTTSVQLVEDCLARIAARDRDLHAWCFIDRELALAQARARDAEPRRSALHGVPVGIKDIFDTCDMPTEYGSPIHKGFRPAVDSVVVAMMRRAGMVILGKCTTTEFASPVPIGVRNPHDLKRTPGVSSSGSAAAVADFMVPLAIGSQTGGSTILPAAFCGITGYKATLTALDRGNIRQLRSTLDTLGLLSRSIADIAALYGVLTGGTGTLAKTDIRKLRIGVCHTNNWQHALPESVDALGAAEKKLAAAGATLIQAELPPVFDGIEDSFGVISTVESARALALEARDHRDKLNFWIKDALTAAAGHSPAKFDQAQRHAVECQRALTSMFERCDVILTPSTNGEAPADLVSVTASGFNRLWTLMHGPCLTIPAYKGPNGMPVGVQVVGPIGSDLRTMSATQAIADVLM